MQGHDCPVRSMTWGHNGLWMVTTDDRGFVKYWQANLNNVHTFQAHTDPVRCSRWDRLDESISSVFSSSSSVRYYNCMSCCVDDDVFAKLVCNYWNSLSTNMNWSTIKW